MKLIKLIELLCLSLAVGCTEFFAPVEHNRPFRAQFCTEVAGVKVYSTVERQELGNYAPLWNACPNALAIEAEVKWVAAKLTTNFSGVSVTMVDDWIYCAGTMAR